MDVKSVSGINSLLRRPLICIFVLLHFPGGSVNWFFEDVVVNHGGNVRNFLDLAPVSKRPGIEEKAVVVK